MSQWKYKVAIVQAHQLKEFNTDKTVAIPGWLLDEMISGTVPTGTPSTHWVVKKPDDSVALYSDEDFKKEFEQ